MRAAALLAVAAALVAGTGVAGAKPQPAPARVQVRGLEFDLLLSKAKLRPGRAIVQFLNAGEDAHNLRLQRVDAFGAPAGAEFGVGEVQPGAYENIDAHLRKRSTYVLWCSLQDHRARGMEAFLRTRRHRHG
jgi:plastocyanin